MFSNRPVPLGFNLKANPVVKSLYTQQADDETFPIPPGSRFRITDDNSFRIIDNGEKRITDN